MMKEEKDEYLIQGTALELVRWILTSDKALEIEFSNFGLFQIEEYKSKETHEWFGKGCLLDILKTLTEDALLYKNSGNYPLGIALI